MNLKTTLIAAFAASFVTSGAVAGVSAAEAAKLGKELTPLGAERAGNASGTIPAWTGGISTPPAGYRGRKDDPFKGEKPLFSITAKNLSQYDAQLTDGVKAMFKRFPDTYRLDVYKTHRTAAAPQWVYDNTAKNAVNGKLDGKIPTGATAGIPFPVSPTGEQIMWNHTLRWRGTDYLVSGQGWQRTVDGKAVLIVDGDASQQFSYYHTGADKSGAPGDYWLVRVASVAPAIRSGEGTVGRNNVDEDKTQVWMYLTGQRRVRKLPNACCDTPSAVAAGLLTVDEIGVWGGRTDRFNWKVVGKQEMFIPYNTNRSLLPDKVADLMGPQHLNPDHVRWELHRVWVVEATLREGLRHQAARSRYYIDEDTWMAVLADRWDGKGQLWKTLWTLPFVAPDLPGVLGGSNGYYDMLNGGYFANELVNEKKTGLFELMPRFKDSMFTPESLAGEGLR